MLEPFRALPQAARAEARAAYRSYLHERDGEPHAARRWLSHREDAMTRYEAYAGTREMDRVLFDAQYTVFDPKRDTPPEMLLLLALVKTNANEAYGVNTVWDSVMAEVAKRPDGEVELMVMLEEAYHTRILLSVADIYGIEIDRPYIPSFAFRSMITGFAVAPKALTMPVQMVSELVGAACFLKLLHRAGDILRFAPEVRDTIEERITSVLIDEIGHVSFCRMSLGSVGCMQARAMLPMIAFSMQGMLPELSMLDAQPSRDWSLLNSLPDEVKRKSFIV